MTKMLLPLLLFFSVSALAQPTVVGTTITVPDDGWYEVQSADDYTTYCEGQLTCTVEPGVYNVINHTTQERFENIPVEEIGNSNFDSSMVVVNGSTISWPDDGWYQVQTATDYQTLCEGGNSCEVPDGNYIVINHSTGERHENVTVSGGEGPGEPGSGVQDGREITFRVHVPAYASEDLQVILFWNDQEFVANQESDGLWVASGFFPYYVRHTLSVLFQDRSGDIVLGSHEAGFNIAEWTATHDIYAYELNTNRWDDDGDGISNLDELIAGTDPLVPSGEELPTVDLSRTYDGLIESLAGYQLDRLALIVEDLLMQTQHTTSIVWPNSDWYQVQDPETHNSVCNGGNECRLVPGSYTVINHSTGVREPLEVPFIDIENIANAVILPDGSFTIEDELFVTETAAVKRTQFACENGGSVTVELVDASPVKTEPPGYDYTGGFKRNGYLFDQCDITVSDGPLSSGNYLLQGSLHSELRRYGGYGNHIARNEFDEFSITGTDGPVYRAQGSTELSYFEGWRWQIQRIATIAEYLEQQQDGLTVESLRSVDYHHTTDSSNTPSYFNFTFATNGSVQNGLTGGSEIAITTESELNANLERVETPVPFNGLIAMSAEDGRVLNLRADPAGDPDEYYAAFVDIEYTDADANQTSLNRVRFNFPVLEGPECSIVRGDEMRELNCSD